jgi:DNA-binding LytR/AlgR family response regulator
MYKCFIIDDEAHAIQTLSKYITTSGLLELVGTSQDPIDAIKYINETKCVDITFLDIDMPEISGLDVAEIIYNNTAIIFTTAHPGYAVQGFEKNISDFLLKPISFERYLKSITKVIHNLTSTQTAASNNADYFFVNPGIKGKLLKINYHDVTYVEGLNNYIVIHTSQQKHIVYLTMKEIEEALLSSLFVRIHKSYIVNLSRMTELEGNTIILDKVNLPVGASYKPSLIQRISGNLIKSRRN